MTIEESTKALNESVAMAIRLAVEQERKKWVPYVGHKSDCVKLNPRNTPGGGDSGRCTCGLADMLEEGV